MDFEYTPEQIHLRKAVREFAEAEIAPARHGVGRSADLPARSRQETRQARLHGRHLPRRTGRRGLGYIEYSIIIEELSRVDGSVGIIVAAHTSLCSNHIYKMGSDEQQRRYLPKLASGEWLGCWSLTEPEAGSRRRRHAHHTPYAMDDMLGSQRRQDVHHQRALRRSSASPWRSPTAPPRSTASPPSSSKRTRPASAAARRKTSSACAPAPPAK